MKFPLGEARFCLFPGSDRFHTTNITFLQRESECPRCKIVQEIIGQGKVLTRTELQEIIEEQYTKTEDAGLEEKAKKIITEVHDAYRNLRQDEVDELHSHVKQRVIFYFAEHNRNPDSLSFTQSTKPVLLGTLLELPVVFDREELITFFGDLYFNDNVRKSIAEHRQLVRIAWRAGPKYYGLLNRCFLGYNAKQESNGSPADGCRCRMCTFVYDSNRS